MPATERGRDDEHAPSFTAAPAGNPELATPATSQLGVRCQEARGNVAADYDGVLAGPDIRSHALEMFIVTEADAAAIRAAFEQEGELSATAELRRLFPAFTDNAAAREWVRTIAGWKPLPVPPKRTARRRVVTGTTPD